MIPLKGMNQDLVRFPYRGSGSSIPVVTLAKRPLRLLLGVLHKDIPLRPNESVAMKARHDEDSDPLILFFKDTGGLRGICEVDRLETNREHSHFRWHETPPFEAMEEYDIDEARRQIRAFGFGTRAFDKIYPQNRRGSLPKHRETLKPYPYFEEYTIYVIGRTTTQLVLGDEGFCNPPSLVTMIEKQNLVVDRLYRGYDGRLFWVRYREREPQSRLDIRERLASLTFDPDLFDRSRLATGKRY